MKKSRFMWLSMAFLLFFAVCAGNLSQTATAQAGEGKTYSIGTDVTFAPFEFQQDGKYVGIDLDLMAAIAKDQNFKYEIRPLGFNAAVQGLQSNQLDGMIAGMSITDERKQTFDFSEPYYESGVVMAVRQDNTEVKSYEDLRGQRVAVKTGTEGYNFANSIKDKYGFTLVPFDDSVQMYEEVTTGNSVACFEDFPVVAYAIQKGVQLKTATEKESGAPYGFAVNKGENQELLQMFNKGLANVKASGEYDQIVSKYLGSTKPGEESTTPSAPVSKWKIVSDAIPALLKGLGMTLMYTIISLFFAFILGLIFGFMKVSPSKTARAIATVFVDIFRGIPLLVLGLFIYFGIPGALGFKMPLIVAAVLALSLNAGAYVTEIIRGGIQSIDKGQLEAARSLGLSHRTAMIKVIIPQAVKVMIPSFINQLVITLKDTSIMSAIGLIELTQSGKLIVANNYQSTVIYGMVAIMYLIVITILTKIADSIERRTRRG